jgi:hypothetical protein
MCIGSYWLSDISYTLCGHAIRRAMGINLSSNYYRVLNDGSEDAADCLRLWYMLYICDQHLSILYGRPTTIRIDDPSLQGWERYLEVRVAVEQDRRTASQVAIMVIMGSIREFFERHSRNTQTLPQSLTEHIASFDRQIDRWVETWYTHLSKSTPPCLGPTYQTTDQLSPQNDATTSETGPQKAYSSTPTSPAYTSTPTSSEA